MGSFPDLKASRSESGHLNHNLKEQKGVSTFLFVPTITNARLSLEGKIKIKIKRQPKENSRGRNIMHLCLRESQNWNITLLSQIKYAMIPA